MRDFAFRLVQLLGTALILAFFSEFYFLNEGPVSGLLNAWRSNPFVALTMLAELAAFYSLFAYGFLIALDRFRVHGLAGLLLAGSIYGLAAEALVVPVVYEAVPVSLVWTSLSWHTLVDVLGGWYFLRWLMRKRRAWPAAAALFLAGAVWGLWATWFWVDARETALTLGAFATLAAVSTSTLLVGMVLADLRPVRRFHPVSAEIWLVALGSGAMLLITGLPFGIAVLLVPALVVLILAALRGEQRPTARTDGGILAALDPRPQPARYLLLALLPIGAVASYALVLRSGVQIPTAEIVPAITFVGAASFLWALALPLWRGLQSGS